MSRHDVGVAATMRTNDGHHHGHDHHHGYGHDYDDDVVAATVVAAAVVVVMTPVANVVRQLRNLLIPPKRWWLFSPHMNSDWCLTNVSWYYSLN